MQFQNLKKMKHFLVSNCFLRLLKKKTKNRKILSISRGYISQGKKQITSYGKILSPIYSLHKYSPRRKASLIIIRLHLKKICTVKKDVLVARRLSVLGLSGKSTNTLSIDVTVRNVDTPETNKSQQVVTVFSLKYAGMP